MNFFATIIFQIPNLNQREGIGLLEYVPGHVILAWCQHFGGPFQKRPKMFVLIHCYKVLIKTVLTICQVTLSQKHVLFKDRFDGYVTNTGDIISKDCFKQKGLFRAGPSNTCNMKLLMAVFCVHHVKGQSQTGKNAVVSQCRQHGPYITYKIKHCWVTRLQPTRRAAVLGQPSSLRPH